MKQFVINVIGILLIFVMAIWQLYDSVDYFSKDIINLTYVFAIAFVGGAIYVFYDKCSLRGRRKLLLWLWGIISIVVSIFSIWFLFTIIQLFYSITGKLQWEFNVVALLIALSFVLVVGACYCWWQFYRIFKKQE